MIQCPHCGHWVRDDAHTCPHCGYRFHSVYEHYSKADNEMSKSDKMKSKQSHKSTNNQSHKTNSTKTVHSNKHHNHKKQTHKKPIRRNKKSPINKKNKQTKKSIKHNNKDKKRSQSKHIDKKRVDTHTNTNKPKSKPAKNYFTRDFLGAVALVAVVVCGTLTIKNIQYHSTPHVNATSIVRNIENSNPAFISHVRYNNKHNVAYVYLSANGKQIINFGATENLKSQLAQREGNINHTNGQFNITHTMYHANEVSQFTHSLNRQKAKINKKYPHFKLKIANRNGYVKRIHDAESKPNYNNWEQTKVVARKILNGNRAFTHQFKFDKRADVVKIVIKPRLARILRVGDYCRRNHITSGYVPVSPNSDSRLCSELTRATYRIGRATRNFNVRVQLIAKVPATNMLNTLNNNNRNINK